MRLLSVMTAAACATLAVGCQAPMATPSTVPAVASTRVQPAAGAGRRHALNASLLGRWRGALEYKDYRDSTKRVTLPTVLDVTMPDGEPGLALHFVYDDGPGKTVVEDDRVIADAEVSRVTWRSGTDNVQTYAASMTDAASAGGRTLVLDGSGRDDDRPAALRETLVVAGDTLRILKEVNFRDHWEFRHAYRFVRAR